MMTTIAVKEVSSLLNEEKKNHHYTKFNHNNSHEFSEEEIFERQEKEKQHRIETEKRLQKLKKLQEEQEQKEQERRQKELLNYMNRKKELDKVAKGLKKTKYIFKEAHNKHMSYDELESSPKTKTCLTPKEENEIQISNSPEKDTIQIFNSPENEAIIIIEEPQSEVEPIIDSIWNENITNESTIQKPSENDLPLIQEVLFSHKSTIERAKQKHRRLPPWKQPPVPIPSAQLLIPKVVVNADGSPKNPLRTCVTANTSESYIQKFKTRAATSSSYIGSRVVDATRQRAM
jgi:hypothetical protein